MKRRKVLVQGAGSVGGILIEHLLNAGAEVLFSEVDDILIQRFKDGLGLQFIPETENSWFQWYSIASSRT